MLVRQRSENLTIAVGRSQRLFVWFLGLLAFILITGGCGGVRNNLRPMDQGQSYSMDEDQEDSLTEELNAKHLEELYAKSGLKDRDHSLEKELRRWSHQSKIDFPIQMNKQVRAYIVYFSTERKGFTVRALARSKRYLPMIKGIFREYGLPTDLAYLAMVESGFNPKARSPAGACGMWQFIKGTGLRYGLVINSNVDERLDPEKSTQAAAEYLLDLYKQFGSWYLAAASYNCGERRVAKELRKSNYRNFWELSANKCIPGETRNYVPQMIAATLIARNPQKFGFGNVPYEPPMPPHKTPDIAVAQVAAPPAETFSPPVQQTRPSQVHIASRPEPQSQKAGFSRKKAKMQAHNVPKKANRKVYANNRKTPVKDTSCARPAPKAASLLGYPRSQPRKTAVSRKKSVSSNRVKRYAKSQKTKSSPALLAHKHRAKKSTRLAKKQSSPKGKFSKHKGKRKVRAFLISEVR